MRKHNFTSMRKIVILHNMGKKNNTSDRNNMATHKMGIVR